MSESLDLILSDFSRELSAVTSLTGLVALKAAYFGKQGRVTALTRGLSELPMDEKKQRGQEIHKLREHLEAQLSSKQTELEALEEEQQLLREKIDLSLPGRARKLGHRHLITQVEHRVIEVFQSLGYAVVTGPEVETDYYNFEALNFPANHPARDMQDTFFVDAERLLRTHTSPIQVRTMEKLPPPLRIVTPGRVYRHDWDATHSPVFHQVEGLCVGPDITFAHLKGTLETLIKSLFGDQVQTRFRPSFFPFTEPSAEVDVMGDQGWLEILGCGMVDPAVFTNVGKLWEQRGEANPYPPEEVTGFAFGLGIERVAMLLHRVSDLRSFFENDVRMLRQF